MDLVWGFFLDISGTWGLRRMFKTLASKQFLPHIQRRIDIEIPSEGHFIHQAAAGRPIEFQFVASNPTPLDIQVLSIDIMIINQEIPLASLCENHTFSIAKESTKGNHKLALYWPLMHPMGLPIINSGWKLKATFHLQCYYGNWSITKESRSFVISGNWQEAHSHLSQSRQFLVG
jgi:hypothetical protein